MIQPAAPSIASALALQSDAPTENGTSGPESASFGDVLAGQTGQPGTAAMVSELPADAAAGGANADLAAVTQPIVAAPLPLAGKILPGLLPDLAMPAAATAPADSAADAAAAAQPGTGLPGLLAALRAIRLPAEPAAPSKAGMTAHAADQATTDGAEVDSEDAAKAQPALAAVLTTTATLTIVTGSADAAATGATSPSLPALIEAQLQSRQLPQAPAAPVKDPRPAATAAPADTTLSLQIDPATTRAAPSAPMVIEAAAAKPMAAVRLRPVVAAASDTTAPAALADNAKAQTEPVNPLASLAPALAGSAVSTATPATASLASVDAAGRPQDFAALMERLITARDAAQTGLPQNVHVALRHADFGPISVTFQQDQNGLAVSVASPDPDFARAVQAAVPAVAAPGATTTDGGTRDSGQGSANPNGTGQSQGFARADGSAAGNESGRQPPRGARAGGPAPAANRTPTGDEPAARARGIFA